MILTEYSFFSNQLIDWYNNNKRDLPWRHTRNPYKIWLSEVILQQTRVDQGLSYYNKFIDSYPTIEDLALAKEEEILKLWQGLGYYSRARNLHFTAKHISITHKGIFPNKHDEILSLKGIGEYTAAAISSFSYNLPYPVIDGNVYRVLSRVFGIEKAIDSSLGKKEFKKLALQLIDKNSPSTYNQAIMEFGALQCRPKSPNCENCPFLAKCFAYNNNCIESLPYKEKKIKQRKRFFNYLVLKHKNKIYLNKREEKDIWIGLFDFPLIETKESINDYNNLLDNNWQKITINNPFVLKTISKEYTHILSHQKIYAKFWVFDIKNPLQLKNSVTEINHTNIFKYPVPKLIDNFINSEFIKE